ncbi:L-aminopeptidase/D-esterase [Slackia heliotrinireducens]|nr:L-aminopeptidase/D-esterase [Slackia heliotrinireducens]
MKSSIGSFAVQAGDLKVGAIVAVNAIGDVIDPATGACVAGVLSQDKTGFRSTEDIFVAGYEAQAATARDAEADALAADSQVVTNTTIAAVITNAKLPKARLCKVASMAHDGFARTIRPVHTSMDGDSIYALSVGDEVADSDTVGVLAAKVMEQAILVAARNAEPAYGLPSVKSLS